MGSCICKHLHMRFVDLNEWDITLNEQLLFYGNFQCRSHNKEIATMQITGTQHTSGTHHTNTPHHTKLHTQTQAHNVHAQHHRGGGGGGQTVPNICHGGYDHLQLNYNKVLLVLFEKYFSFIGYKKWPHLFVLTP